MAGAGPAGGRPVHGRPRYRDRERGAALDQDRPRVLAAGPAVGDQRVRTLLRRLPAPRRAGGRPARTTPVVPHRPRRLHGGLALRGPRLVGGVAARGALGPGARRGDRHAGGSVDPDDHVQRRARAEHRARRVGRGRRVRRRRRRPARRHPHGPAELGVDLLPQRAGRGGGLRPRAVAPEREPRRKRALVRRARCGARHRRPVLARLRDHAGGQQRLGLGEDAGLLRRIRGAPRERSPSGSSGTPSR